MMTSPDRQPPGDQPSRADPLHQREYDAGAAVVLTEAERHPTLSEAGRARLQTILDDPDAAPWTHRAGDRLSAAAVSRAARPRPTTDWLAEHLAVARALPAYRGHPGPLAQLSDFPLVDREDLMADMAGFVPRDADLDELVHGSSSGSTGHALAIPDELTDVARTFTWLVAVVRNQGADWRPDPARLALAYVVAQRQAYTYASTLSTFGEATMARLNLDGRVWSRAPRAAFLQRHQPQVFTGSPDSLAELLDAELAATLTPLALVSGATELTPALRADLGAAYGCPVLDVYGLHETRPIAVSADGGPHVIADRRVLVEVFGPDDEPVPAGVRGELVVTAGENPLLPLVRYRTGDFGRLVEVRGRPAIADLEGRAGVNFVAADGARIPSVDLTQLLQAAGAYGWSIVQHADGDLDVTLVRGDADQARSAVAALLGRPLSVHTVDRLADLGPGKPRRYSRLT